jgi:hypothetical protein
MEGYDSDIIPERHVMLHYHGDAVRALFFTAALVLVVAQSTGAALPLSAAGAVFAAVLLVVAAGITNPDQPGIHWVNALLAIFGTLLFGNAAVEHYRAGEGVFNLSFTYIETLAIISLVALYFTTRTIRGIIQRPNLS